MHRTLGPAVRAVAQRVGVGSRGEGAGTGFRPRCGSRSRDRRWPGRLRCRWCHSARGGRGRARRPPGRRRRSRRSAAGARRRRRRDRSCLRGRGDLDVDLALHEGDKAATLRVDDLGAEGEEAAGERGGGQEFEVLLAAEDGLVGDEVGPVGVGDVLAVGEGDGGAVHGVDAQADAHGLVFPQEGVGVGDRGGGRAGGGVAGVVDDLEEAAARGPGVERGLVGVAADEVGADGEGAGVPVDAGPCGGASDRAR
jgi:hypothetical protein